VDVVDGGTLGLMLMPYIAGREAVLVLDAVSQAHGAPGRVIVLGDGQVRSGHGVRVTAHEIGLVDALSAAPLAGCAPPRVTLVGIARSDGSEPPTGSAASPAATNTMASRLTSAHPAAAPESSSNPQLS
jgi:hydrogenase maturation protease